MPAPAGVAAATAGPKTRSRANASAGLTSRQPGKEGGAAAVESAEQVLRTIATMLRVRHGVRPFRLNFHHFDHFELDLCGHMHVRGAVFSCLRLKLADIVLI